MSVPAKGMVMFGLFLMLAGCAAGKNELATRPLPPIQERTYEIENQKQDIMYVPVLRTEHPDGKARAEDTLKPQPTLDACKQALAAQVAESLTGHWKNSKVTEQVCYEVRKSGGQRKIVVG